MPITPQLLLSGYCQGIFPMADEDEIFWYDPDPRAIILKARAKELASAKGRSDELQLYFNVEELTPGIFQRVKGSTKVISPNVDFFSGFVYDMLGFPQEIYTPMFAMARVVGWSAHRIDELMNGGRIIRPGYKSVAGENEYIPLKRRS